MEIGGKRVLVCNCEATMPLDGRALARACGAQEAPVVHTQLCRAQLDRFRRAAADGMPLLVGCTQERPLFAEVLGETAPDTSAVFVNIRERAGWSEEGAAALPKIAALLAEAAVEVPPTPALTLRSGGVCLVYGRDETALDAARQLAGRLDATVLLTRPGEVLPPGVMAASVFRGTITAASGHLGAFELTVDDYAPARPSSRGALAFERPRDGARSRCDLILDLTGGAPLFPAGSRRDGYLRPDPGNPAAVQRALFDLVDLVGEFDKPRYVEFHPSLCAHSRSRITGCTRCLDVCPTGAIRPDGDTVAIDPYICGGCGMCHSVCPTGAAQYAMPPMSALGERLRTLLRAYARAGGERPALLVIDPRTGEDSVAAIARLGRGLPANVLPFTVNEVTQVGLDLLTLAFAYGAQHVVVLAPPEKRDELAPLEGQIAITAAILAGLGHRGDRIHLLVEADPEAVERALHGLAAVPAMPAGDFLAMGDKRSLLRLALGHLGKAAPRPPAVVPLPAGAPFGTVELRVEGCTLCLACVGACPTGALGANPERPQLSFREDACVQCGLCKAICPEKVITLVPRLDPAAAAAGARVLKEEEPYPCIRCGKPFGTRGTIERIMAQLANRHAMFRTERAARLIQMCEGCRVAAQFEAGPQPLAGAARPLPRTTDDDLREREAEARRQRDGEA